MTPTEVKEEIKKLFAELGPENGWLMAQINICTMDGGNYQVYYKYADKLRKDNSPEDNDWLLDWFVNRF